MDQRGARPRGVMPQPIGPQTGAECSALPALVAKVEKARLIASLAQLGQTIRIPFVSPRMSFSKRSPHSWQMYS